MSGGRIEFGLGTGWFAAEHAAYGVPVPRRAVRHARGAARDRHGAVGDAGRRAVLVTRGALRARRLAGAAQARAAADPRHRRRRGADAHAPARGPVRARVQRAVPLERRDRGRVRPGARGGRVGRARPGVARLLGGAHHDRRERPRPTIGAAPSASGAIRPSCAAPASAAPRQEVIDRIAGLAELGVEAVYLQVLDFDDPELLEFLAGEVVPYVA